MIGAGVAAGHKLTAEAAREVLRSGGTAVDAVIAGLWAACVVEPVFASPGGGGFMMIGTAGRPDRTRLLDFFVDTPDFQDPSDLDIREVQVDFGTAKQSFCVGSGTSATPGMGPGLFEAHARYGRLPMTELVAPAIHFAKSGILIEGFQAKLFRIIEPILRLTEKSRSLYDHGDTIKGEGDFFTNPDLSDALDWMARDGVRALTKGDIAQAILDSQEGRGTLTAERLSAYRPEWRQPGLLEIGPFTCALNPPPSAGGSLITAMMNELKRSQSTPAKAIANAIRRVDRRWADSGRQIGRFLDASHNKSRSAPRGTTHISVIDKDGLAVAATVSNGEGNGIIVPGCGFMPNNMMGEEDVNPGGFDPWVPGMRLSSMMAPTIVSGRQGRIAALGSGGSNRIRTAMFQVLTRHFGDEEGWEAAIHAPRMHIEGDHLDFEDFYREDDRENLTGAFEDHLAWPERSMFFGGVHAVERDENAQVIGGGDPRRDGVFERV